MTHSVLRDPVGLVLVEGRQPKNRPLIDNSILVDCIATGLQLHDWIRFQRIQFVVTWGRIMGGVSNRAEKNYAS